MKSRVFILLIITALILSACALPFNQRPGDPPTNVQIVPDNCRVAIDWTDPSNKYFDRIEIRFSPPRDGIEQPIIVAKGVGSATITGLINGTSYAFTLTSITSGGAENEGKAPVVYARPMPPLPAIISQYTTTDSITVTWDPASSIDDAEIMGLQASCFSVKTGFLAQQVLPLSSGRESLTFTGLQDEEEYACYFSYINNPGNASLTSNKMGAGFIIRTGMTGAVAGDSAVHPGRDSLGVRWNDPECVEVQLMAVEVYPRRPGTDPVTYVGRGIGYHTYEERQLSSAQETYLISLSAIDVDNREFYLLRESGPVRFDHVAPGLVGDLRALPRNGGALLTWSNPSDTSLKSVEIKVYSSANEHIKTSVAETGDSLEQATITGLNNDETYYFSAVTIDWADNRSPESSRVSIIPNGKQYNPVSSVEVTPKEDSLYITWTEPEPDQTDHEIEVSFISGADKVSPRAATVIHVRPGLGKALALGLRQGESYTLGVTVVGTNGERSETIQDTGIPSGSTDLEPGDFDTFQLATSAFDMIFVPATPFTSALPAGASVSAINDDYWLGETEITFAVWDEVEQWAIPNGYTFVNQHLCGSHNDSDKQQPVANISWRESLVWLNAATEYYNYIHGASLRCVYYADRAMTRPIRSAVAPEALTLTKGQIDNPYIDLHADGFRMPTFGEWELADRLNADETVADGDIWAGPQNRWTSYWTYGENASLEQTVLFHSGPVASKIPNDLGFRDLHGNMWEFCWDPADTIENYDYPVIRYIGGSWANQSTLPCDYFFGVGGYGFVNPWDHDFWEPLVPPGHLSYRKGLRLARTAYW